MSNRAVYEAFEMLAKEIGKRRIEQARCNSTLGRRERGEPEFISDATVYEGAFKEVARRLREHDATEAIIDRESGNPRCALCGKSRG